MKVNTYFKQYTKMNSKWTNDLNLRGKIIELSEENTKVNLDGLGLAMISRYDTKR